MKPLGRSLLWSAMPILIITGATGICMGQETKRPNFVIVYTDDQNLNEYNCYGGKVLSPNLDRMAKEGMRFDRFYISSAVCGPSRYSALTGRYASRSANNCRQFKPGQYMNLGWGAHLHADVKAGIKYSLPQVLRRNGYFTGMVGKWDQGPGEQRDKEYPTNANWHTKTGQALAQERYAETITTIKSCGFDYADGVYRGNPLSIMPKPLAVHNQEWVTQAALTFLDKAANRPFFLYMATTLTHAPDPVGRGLKADPRVTPAGYLDKPCTSQPSRKSVFTRTKQARVSQRMAGVTWLDDAVGAVFRKLEAMGGADNTVVIVASDNGKKGKFSCYDAGARMPMLVRWPGHVKPGSVCRELTSNIDFAPTLYELAGCTPEDKQAFDGRSLVPLLTGKGSFERPSLYLEIASTRAVVTEDFFKYVAVRFEPEIQQKVAKGARYTHWALPIEEAHHTYRNEKNYPAYFDADQLYDLRKDPGEQKNLAANPAYAERLKSMKAELTSYVKHLPHAFGEFGNGSAAVPAEER